MSAKGQYRTSPAVHAIVPFDARRLYQGPAGDVLLTHHTLQRKVNFLWLRAPATNSKSRSRKGTAFLLFAGRAAVRSRFASVRLEIFQKRHAV